MQPLSDIQFKRALVRESGIGPRGSVATRAFTLIELLVVIVIIGLLAGLGLPAIRGMSRTNALSAADRQLLDDLAYARQRAISDHTTVYMVFIPPAITNESLFPNPMAPDSIGIATELTNLFGGQFTTYALISLRSVGDQPGRPTPRYLTDWRTLPDGVFIPSEKFGRFNLADTPQRRAFRYGDVVFPFPYITNNCLNVYLPYIAFDYLGQLTSQLDEYIPIAQGSVFYERDTGNPNLFSRDLPELAEKPRGNTVYDASYPNNAYNQVQITWLTGRARIQKAEIR